MTVISNSQVKPRTVYSKIKFTMHDGRRIEFSDCTFPSAISQVFDPRGIKFIHLKNKKP